MSKPERDLVKGWLGLLCLSVTGLLAGPSRPAQAQVVSGSYVGNGTGGRKITGLGFRPDLVLVKGDDNQAGGEILTSAVMRTSTMGPGDVSKPVNATCCNPANPASPVIANQITSIDTDGFTLGSDRRVAQATRTFYWAAFKANANMKVGKYTGDGAPSHAIAGLGFSPEFVIVLPEDTGRGIQACSATPVGRSYGFDVGAWLSSQITSLNGDGFTVSDAGTYHHANVNGVVYHYVAWNASPGSVAVGSYQGDGVDTRAIPGVGFRPEFLFVKFIYNLNALNDPTQSPPGHFRTASMPYDTSLDYARGVANNHLEDFLDDGFQIGNAWTINRAYGDCEAPGCEYAYVAINHIAPPYPPVAATETPTTITVTAPYSFEMTFSSATGGGLQTFYDLAENPARTYDLAGSLAGDVPALHNAGLSVGGAYYNTARNDAGASLALLEATSVRTRVRSESFYQNATLGPLAGVKMVADYSIYPSGRMAHRSERRASAAVTYASEYHELVMHQTAAAPLNAWAMSSTTDNIPPNPGTDAFLLAQKEVQWARTDFLETIYKDWSVANGHLETANIADWSTDAANQRLNAYWDETTGATIPANTAEAWDFLTYFKPTNLASNVDAAVTSRSADYRTPSTVTVGPGAQWQDAAENTSTLGDFFNEAEGAYLFDLDPASGLTLALDGSGTTRRSPFFKIRRWQSFSEAPIVTFDPDGPGAATPVALVKDVGYRAAVKPVARSQFAPELLWYSTLQDAGSVTTPFVGNGTGTTLTGVTFGGGRYGQGAVFDSVSDEIKVVVQPGAGKANVEFDRGRIEFWYRPNNAHTDNAQHYLFDIDSDNVDYNSSRIRIKKEANTCGGCENALTAEVTDATGFAMGVTIPSTNYSWRAGDWVHLALEWDSTAATDNIRAYMNGIKLVPTAVHNGVFTMSAETAAGVIRIGNKAVSPGSWNADGIIDEFKIYSAPLTEIAHGGLTSDSRESLASSTNNASLALQPVDTYARGPYLFFGFDSKPKGLNVSLATAGAGVADNQVQWFYWNGTTWGAAAPTDGTRSFKKSGTISWTADWAGWSPYSLDGGPELYYMVARLGGVTGYTTTPVERQIKTDILLFQYCADVTTASATFAFGVPPPTAVTLMSFSAAPGDSSVTLEWRTGSELDNLGFHLHRGPSEAGPWTRLTSLLIPGLGSSPLGQAYSWLDAGLVNGVRYYYRLEDVDTSSKSTFHGPVSTVPVPASSPPGEGGGDGGGGDGTEGGRPGNSPSCPSWVLSAAPDAVSPVCTRYGDPESTSLQLLARDGSSATVELRTGGFWTLQDSSGTVRVFVPGLELPSEARAAALPVRRALVDAVVGKGVALVSAEALDLRTFRGLRPAAVGAAEIEVGGDGTVRPARRSVAAPLLARGYQPSEVARLAGTVFQGERKSAVVEMTPVRWSGSGLVLAGRVRVRLAFAGAVEGESGAGSRGRSVPRGKAFFRDVLAQLYTSKRGLHAVRFEELFAERPRAFPTRVLRLERQGEVIAFHVEPEGPAFGPGGVLYFFADRTASSTDYSSEVAYELVRSREGSEMAVKVASPQGAALASPSAGLASFETNRIYQPGLVEAPDVWLWDAVASGAVRVEPFVLSGVATGSEQPARLDVHLQGGSDSGETSADHHVRVSVNGVDVGEASFDGKRAYPLSASLPASLLREGTNELAVANVGDTGVSSLVFLDGFEVGYPQVSSARGGVFEGEWGESGTVEVGGLSGAPIVLDVTTSGAWVRGLEAAAGSVRFQAEAGHRYLVVTPEGLLAPRIGRVIPSTLREGSNQADYVVIAPREFLGAAARLVERRGSQGLVSRAVSLEEIASEFGHGRASGEAVKAFLSYAYHSWRRPSPRYVLLLGDATYDPRHFVSTSWPSPLPALWVKTSYLWTASDSALGAVNGEDALPDLSIGRLPATTVEEAEGLVGKLITWEESGQALTGKAVLVADAPDAGGDFEADVQDIHDTFLADRATETLKVRELGSGTRPAILDAFDEGASLMSYVGHGGTAVWSSQNVLNSWDVASLRGQSRQPVLLTLDCLNGYFVAPSFDALPEALLKAEGRGAVAAVSPSGLSLDGPAHEYHRALVGELVSGRHERLGDAVLAAQRAYAETGLMPELLEVYQLLGDPAMRIR